MESLPLLLGGGFLAAAVVLYVLLPLVRGREAPMHRTSAEYSEDEFRRQVALSALRDVEYDFATGKMDEEDYRELKRELSVEALQILESLRDPAPASAEEGGEGEEPEPASEEEMDALEREIARIREGLEEGRACRWCAHLSPPGSRFCGRCGRELDEKRASRAAGGGSG